MKQVKCEMCGSLDLIKEDSFYVCNHCGMKYSVEEARKLMVEIEGAVKIDSSEELANLYVLARRARDAKNSEDAQKYYNQILLKDPMNWEPVFYSLIYNSICTTLGQLHASCVKVKDGLPSIIELVKDTVSDKEEQRHIYNEMANMVNWAARVFFGNAQENFERRLDERRKVFIAAIVVIYSFADRLSNEYPDGEFMDAQIACIKQAVLLHSILIKTFSVAEEDKKLYLVRAQYVKQYDPTYDIPEVPGLTTNA